MDAESASRSSAPGFRLFVIYLALAASTVLAALNTVNILGGLYAMHAQAHLDAVDAPDVVGAARFAARLTPWSSARVEQYGWLLAEHGEVAAGETAYGEAVRWAPADPMLWEEFALALSRNGQFSPRLDAVVVHSNELAPTSPAVQIGNASMALSYWKLGSGRLRTAWLQSLRFELTNNRSAFLDQVVAFGHWRLFCEALAPNLGEQAWCEQSEHQRAACVNNPEDPAPICDYVE